MSEMSFPDSYDSLSDVQVDDQDAAFFPRLSAFPSQEEIHRSLNLARRATANSEAEACASETEIPQVVSHSPGSLCRKPSHQEGGSREPATPGRPLDPRPTRGQPSTSRAGRVASPRPTEEGGRLTPTGQPQLHPQPPESWQALGPASPTPAPAPRPGPRTWARPPHVGQAGPGRAGPQSQLRDKAASFI